MVNSIDELIDILETQNRTILKFKEVASQLGIVFSDFQLGQLENTKRMTLFTLEQLNELSEALKGE